MKYVYCDESCHLQNDNSDYMVLGAISCFKEEKNKIFEEIKDIKEKHNLDRNFEIKWTKVSNAKIEFYEEIIDYFFKKDTLRFRTIVADKTNLKFSDEPNDDYASWYYKIYFYLLGYVISTEEEYRIFLDVKDSLGGERVRELKKIICNKLGDFQGESLKDICQIHSDTSQILQITDLLIGAMSYHARGLDSNLGKVKIINKINKKLRDLDIDLNFSTKRNEEKFNIFYWKGVVR
ncbi:DUF3800 domain-containing protein [Fusobacterium sp. MFO224]|uniref:DUF3800 domain-containing protein n=1 Tax=Fusobacterium sp. MFO224 TaxID=3378070 RepID=UPI003853AB3A